MPPSPDDEAILIELERLSRDPARGLLQFLSLAGARQYRALYPRFRRYVPPGAAVLDWGPGNGHFSYFLTRAGFRATGFSFVPYSYQAWLGDPSYRFVIGTPSEPVALPFRDSEFDAVASIGVLEHVRETGGTEAASLAEIARVLRPGGIFLAYHFPNRTSAIDFVASRTPGKHHHEWRYGRSDIEALTRGAGLDLIEARRYGILPRNSCHRLLGPLRHSRAAANVWDALDDALGAALSPLCQNWLFVARKPER